MIICLLSIHENVLNDQTPANLVFEGRACTACLSLFPRRVAEARIAENIFFEIIFFQSLIACLDTFALAITIGCLYPANALQIEYRTHVAGPLNESL
jgi:hypothetical protein